VSRLDISDEFKQVISTLRGHDDKVRIITNSVRFQADKQHVCKRWCLQVNYEQQVFSCQWQRVDCLYCNDDLLQWFVVLH